MIISLVVIVILYLGVVIDKKHVILILQDTWSKRMKQLFSFLLVWVFPLFSFGGRSVDIKRLPEISSYLNNSKFLQVNDKRGIVLSSGGDGSSGGAFYQK